MHWSRLPGGQVTPEFSGKRIVEAHPRVPQPREWPVYSAVSAGPVPPPAGLWATADSAGEGTGAHLMSDGAVEFDVA